MKATDVMIGDWVLFPVFEEGSGLVRKLFKVNSIHTDCVTLINSKGNYYTAKEGEFEPIPLTPEILEINGFEKNSGDTTDYYANREIIDLIILFNKTVGVWQFYYNSFKHKVPIGNAKQAIVRNDCFIIIKYLHELQHALRLCGIDKEIEL